MNKFLILSGMWILLTIIVAGSVHDRGEKDGLACLLTGIIVSTPITMIVWGLMWNLNSICSLQ